MNTDNQIDKLFREGLAGKGKEPPAHLWTHISALVKEPGTVNGNRKRRKVTGWWIAGGAILLVALLWLVIDKSVPSPEQVTILQPVVSPMKPEQAVIPETSSIAAIPSHTRQQPIRQSPVYAGTIQESPFIIPETHDEESILITEQSHPVSIEVPDVEPVPGSAIIPPPEFIPDQQMNTEANGTTPENPSEPQPTINPDTTSPVRSTPRGIPVAKEMKSMMRELLLGLSFHAGPELYKAVKPYPGTLRSGYEGTLNGHLQYRNLVFTTGIGLSGFTDINPWKATITRSDTVAWYKYVTSVSFQPVYDPIDSTIIGYVPANIITANHPSVDTVTEDILREVKNHYTLIQIPLLLGYTVLHHEHLTVGVSGGMIWNLIVTKDQPVPVFPGETLVSPAVDLGLTRREQYWQYQLGFNLRYMLGDKWFAEGCFAVRKPLEGWYLKPEPAGKPTSFLVTAGMGFWL